MAVGTPFFPFTLETLMNKKKANVQILPKKKTNSFGNAPPPHVIALMGRLVQTSVSWCTEEAEECVLVNL